MVVNLNQTVLNLKTSMEIGFANVNQRLDKVESRLDNLEKDVAVFKQDVADIKRCPIIQKELNELKKIN